jgi:hypothetical protein
VRRDRSEGEQNVEEYGGRFLGDPTKTPVEICPHCGVLNAFPPFDQVLAYICHSCGESIDLPLRDTAAD